MTDGRGLARRAAVLGLAAVAVVGVGGLLVHALGGSRSARAYLGFRFDPPPRTQRAVLEVATANLRLVAAALVAALAARAAPRLRWLLDLALVCPSALNVAALAAALGAYGHRLLAAVALHGPFELAAFALVGGTYLSARAGELPTLLLLRVTGAAVALVASGALIESYVRIGGLA